MDTHIIKMPDIGEGIAEVEIVEWHVKVGDTVTEDQTLADVMTDKASVEIPSPVAGRVVSLGGQVGEILAVGSPLITLEPAAATAAASVKEPQPQAETPPGQLSSPQNKADIRADTDSRPKEGQVDESQTVPDTTRKSARGTGKKALASPSVRHRARQLDIDLQDLVRADADTPVSHRDLDEFLLSRFAPDRSGPRAGQAGEVTQQAGVGREVDDVFTRGDTQVNVVGLRRQIAIKMQEAKRQIPHFTYVEEVDVTNLEQLRQTLNNQQEPDQERLTVLPFLVRAIVQAVRRHPEINARYDADGGVVTQFGAVHMGIATQTDNGLMVPVIHDAQNLDIWECALEIKRTAGLARRGTATRHDLTGSTLTISSLGSLGGIAATPIINHPEVAIVGVNRIVERPVYQDGVLVPRKMMNLSSSFDHRVVDGMNAAQFIQEVRRLLECPALLFVRDSP